MLTLVNIGKPWLGHEGEERGKVEGLMSFSV